MTEPIPTIEADLEGWLARQPVWLQHGASVLIEGGVIEKAEISRFAEMAISEVNGTLAPPDPFPQLSSLGGHAGGVIKLDSLSNISGIGRLNPRNPLSFGGEKLAVVYGPTGSGKSSYVRILKHACGARHRGAIHPNVFESVAVPQSCTISYSDATGSRSIAWNPSSGGVPDLLTVDIFDTLSEKWYLDMEAQPTYAPRPLTFLSMLAGICDRVAAELAAAISAKAKALPMQPHEYGDTNGGRWYAGLAAATKQEEVDAHCSWTERDQEELDGIVKYLAETSPKDRVKELEVKKGYIDGLVSSLKEHCAAYSEENCCDLMGLRSTAMEKQQTAELAAKTNFEAAVLNGVGTKQWLGLWSIARTYSVEAAYPGKPFPHTDGDARCVLCQQELSPEAKTRLLSFDQYVKNEAAAAAKAAKDELQKALDRLPALPETETLKAKCTSAGMDASMTESLDGFYTILKARRSLLLKDEVAGSFGDLPATGEWEAAAEGLADGYAAQAKAFREEYNEADRTAKQAKYRDLAARKWLAGQKPAIEAEIKRLEEVSILGNAKDLCKTKAISDKNGTLARVLITPAYIEAFNRELTCLGAKRVRVELVPTRVERGAILHQVRLKDDVQQKPIHEVLSEGEHRIVSLAAFLADVSSNPNGSAFVFDDPISSLDLDFEEAVAQRLVELSASRQVIVFTHRLSLLGMLQDYSKKADVPVQVFSLSRAPWGVGEPGDQTIETAKPKKVVNQLLPDRIKAARAALDKEGAAIYRLHAQAICTETRKLVERMIEMELLGDVVQRHRRAINTQGKLDKLSDIQPEDCAFIDEMMTKYSRYEHAQSAEAPVELPTPDELDEDVTRLKTWRDNLEERRK